MIQLRCDTFIDELKKIEKFQILELREYSLIILVLSLSPVGLSTTYFELLEKMDRMKGEKNKLNFNHRKLIQVVMDAKQIQDNGQDEQDEQRKLDNMDYFNEEEKEHPEKKEQSNLIELTRLI